MTTKFNFYGSNFTLKIFIDTLTTAKPFSVIRHSTTGTTVSTEKKRNLWIT